MGNEQLFVDKAKRVFPIMFEGLAGDQCWVWSGRATWVTEVNGKLVTVSLARIAHAALIGPIPKYHDVKTTCKQTGCVNPNHLTTKKSLRQIGKALEREAVQSSLEAAPSAS